jgi:2-C-methyl-D-erythritol 4-phosphate cytidylyltransferase
VSDGNATRTVAVVLCAGQGTRMGAPQNKVYLPVAGKPLLLYALAAFARAAEVDEVLLVANPAEVAYCEEEIVQQYTPAKVIGVIAGGATRHRSEERALEALRARIVAGTIDVVLIHDGARPFVTPEEIDAVAQAARAEGGALLGTPVGADEVVAQIGEDGSVEAILPSVELWRAQTPQAFAAQPLLAAYDQARADGFEGTDTAGVYERLGRPVRMVEGSPDNFKVTTPEDLLRAESWVRRRSTGT